MTVLPDITGEMKGERLVRLLQIILDTGVQEFEALSVKDWKHSGGELKQHGHMQVRGWL